MTNGLDPLPSPTARARELIEQLGQTNLDATQAAMFNELVHLKQAGTAAREELASLTMQFEGALGEIERQAGVIAQQAETIERLKVELAARDVVAGAA